MPHQVAEPSRPEPDGVCVAEGYGLRIAVERRHLIVTDGAGRERRRRRYPKVGHGLQRLVILGHTGTISLEALRWLDRVRVEVVHVDSDCTVLTASARPGLDDARLRRAQALAADTPTGLEVIRGLLGAKLAGQTSVAADQLDAPQTAALIDDLRQRLSEAATPADARDLEAKAAHAYFGAWQGRVALTWATKDRDRIPSHWTRFDGRRSPLATGASIRAADPLNALLNYLYALAEAECRLACLTLGLDPGIGFLHADVRGRDSLALDLIEVVRPAVDAFVIDLADGHTFRRADFHEQDDGHCRILPPLTHRLAATMPRWAEHVAPAAEQVAHLLADASPYRVAKATPLTSSKRREAAQRVSEARRKTPRPAPTKPPHRPATGLARTCVDCGGDLDGRAGIYCAECWPTHRTEAGVAGSTAARAQLTDPDTRRHRGQAVASGKAAAFDARVREHGWEPEDWTTKVWPKVKALSLRQITEITGLSTNQASRFKRGVQVAPPKHWQGLYAGSAEPT